jgi:osmoprotectant transport system substrate-binding protein
VRALRPAIIGSTVLLGLAACGDGDDRVAEANALGDDAITVGSFDFPESILLAELYSQGLEEHGIRVERALGLGPREFVGAALSVGLVELVPEYVGTALTFFSAGTSAPSADAEATYGDLEGAVAGTDVAVLAPARAQNANTFVVRKETAERYGLVTLSDLAAVAPELVLGGPPECPTRPLCEVGLREVYGLDFEEFVPLDAGGPMTHRALGEGFVDVAVLFGTDPRLDEFTVLTDDRHLQPAENVVPLVHATVLERFGSDAVAAIDAVSHRLDVDGLRRLNAQDAATPGAGDVAAIAASWLEAEGLT